MTTNIKHVTVLGTGVLGSQIAYQAAYAGFDVTSYDISEAIIEKARQRYSELAKIYAKQVPGAADGRADAALERLRLTDDLQQAVADADLVIEAIPENLEIKRTTYEQLGKLAPASTIFATNSSTLLPSDLKAFTGRPEKFLALHFANEIWLHNTAEVMGTPDTDPQVFAEVSAYAEAMGMVPIEIKKEQAGYLLNSLLVPLLDAASQLAANGVAEPEMIDRTWKIATGAPVGPFGIFDVIGLTTPYNIAAAKAAAGDPAQKMIAAYFKQRIDEGKLGVATGEGFYKYPAPAAKAV